MAALEGRQVTVRHEPGLESHPAFSAWSQCVQAALKSRFGEDVQVSFFPAEPHQHPRVFLGAGFADDDGRGRVTAEEAVAAVGPCEAALAQPAGASARLSAGAA